MNVERVDKEPGKESSSKKVADMDSLCEEISRAIVEGLVEKEILDEPEIGTPPESHIAETAVIGSFEDVQADQMATAVESLLESDVLSEKIVRLVQEKIRQVIDDDVVQSRRGDSGIIAERVHLECTRLFARESFRNDIVKLVRADVEHTLAPALRRDMSACMHGMVTEIAGLLVERVAGELAKMKETASPSAAETRAAAPAAEACTAPPAAEPCAAPAVTETFAAPPAIEPRAAPDRPGTRIAAPGKPLPSFGCTCDADERAASAYLRIRDRLLWQGAL